MKRFFAVAMIALTQIFAAGYDEPDAWNPAQKTSPFTEIAQKNIPAVVLIETQIEDPRNETSEFFGPRPDPFFEEFLRRFFGSHKMNSSSSPFQAAGSGFFVSEDGLIVTNHHVINKAKKVAVVLHDGRKLDAVVVGADPETDIAVLQIDVKGVSYVHFGDSDQIVVAQPVLAVGHPFKLNYSVTQGIVSAVPADRNHLDKITKIGSLLQTDAAINSGNSGGPLFDKDGKVIGMNVAILAPSGGFVGIGFAIPSNTVANVLERILEKGYVDRAYLGIILQNIDADLAEATHLQEKGILIAEVVKDSPAKKADLRSGDIILEMNGVSVKNMNAFRNKIAMMSPETTVSLTIRRKSETLVVDVRLGVLSELTTTSAKIFEKLGLKVDDLENISANTLANYGYDQGTSGVFITQVDHSSPAAYAGIRSHQLITGVVTNWNSPKEVHNLEDLKEALRDAEGRRHVVLIIRHKNMQRYCTIKVP